MPKKLDRCVKKVKKQGKSEDSAYAICSNSTGIKRKKGGSWTKGKKIKKESINLPKFDSVFRMITEKKK